MVEVVVSAVLVNVGDEVLEHQPVYALLRVRMANTGVRNMGNLAMECMRLGGWGGFGGVQASDTAE